MCIYIALFVLERQVLFRREEKSVQSFHPLRMIQRWAIAGSHKDVVRNSSSTRLVFIAVCCFLLCVNVSLAEESRRVKIKINTNIPAPHVGSDGTAGSIWSSSVSSSGTAVPEVFRDPAPLSNPPVVSSAVTGMYFTFKLPLSSSFCQQYLS